MTTFGNRSLQKVSRALLSILGFLVCWELLVQMLGVRSFILPAPTAIGIEMWTTRSIWPQHVWATLMEALIGLLIATVFAVVLAVLMHRFRPIQTALHPLIVATQAIPIIAISPLFIIWFDYTIWSKVAVVVLWTFFPVVSSMLDGFASVSNDRRLMLLSLGATRKQLFLYLEWPTCLPYFFSGLQMAAAFSVMAATVGEWLGAEEGLGFLARRASNNLQTELLFVAVVLLVGMGLVLFYVTKWMGTRFIRWQGKD